MLRSFLIAFSMYSKIPMPRTEWTKENMKYVMCFFPLVGTVIGGLVLLWAYVGSLLLVSHVFYTIILILIPLMVTGGIHMDGLMDTADARSSYGTREKKLEILKDPHTGAFGILACVGYFFLSFGVWYEASSYVLPLLALNFTLSRALSGLAVVTFPLAKNSGLAASFSTGARKGPVRAAMGAYLLLCLGIMIFFDWKLGIVNLLSVGAVFAWYYWMAVREFGGITGDLAGYFLQICELAAALCLVMGDKLCG